jgi:hypothetical protein
MQVPLWVFIVSAIIFIAVLIREIIVNNNLEKYNNLLSMYLGYMVVRFDYSPTYEDVTHNIGIEDKIEKILKECEDKKNE